MFSFEHVIILFNKKKERDEIVSLNLYILIFTTIFFFLCILFFGDLILDLLNAKILLKFKYSLILLILTAGIYVITRNIFLSNNNYKGLAKNNIIYQIFYSCSQIGFGVISPKYFSLVLGQLLAFIISSGLTFKQNLIKITFDLKLLKKHFSKNIKFLYFETPSSFLNIISLQLPIFFITKYHGIDNAGYYSMALVIVNAPMTLFTNSITQVYFKSASDLYNTNKSEMIILYKNTFKKLTYVILIPSIILIIFSELIVDIFLGSNWSEVVWILQVYIFSKIFEFLHTPLNTTLLILNKQEISFYMMLFGFIIKFSSLFFFRFDFQSMIISLTIASSIYHLLHNFAIYRILKSI